MFKRFLLLAVLATTGCSTMQYTANPQAGSDAGVQVLYAYPDAQYDNLGVIDFEFYQPGWREPTVTDALPKLKEKVAEVGGNALIVRNQRIGRFNARYITISAEALRVDWSTGEP